MSTIVNMGLDCNKMMAMGDQKKVSSPLKGPIVQVGITLEAILAKT